MSHTKIYLSFYMYGYFFCVAHMCQVHAEAYVVVVAGTGVIVVL